MTHYQRFYDLQNAIARNANEVGEVQELRSLFPYDRDLLHCFLRLAKEREYIIDELKKLPQQISA